MIKQLATTLAIICLILIIVCVGHYFVVQKLDLYFSILNVYAFNFAMTFCSLAALLFIQKNFNDKVGYTFLGLGIIKMMLSLVYLMPLIKSAFLNKIPDTLNFFFCYFLFLLMESIVTVKMLNKNNEH
jgi:hypothetical protein